MAEYAGRLPLFHIDLYRLADAATRSAGGLIDDRQAPASPSSSGPTGWARRCPAGGSTWSSTGAGEDPRAITLRALGAAACAAISRPSHDGRRRRSSPSTAPRPGSSWPPATPDGALLDGATTGRPAIATARRCCRRSTPLLGRPGSTATGSRRSWSAPDPARSPGCGSGSRRPRGSPMALGRPIVGVSTGEALLAATAGRRLRSCCLPAGPSDRLARPARGQPALLPAGAEPELERRRDRRRGRPRRACPGRRARRAARRRGPGLGAALIRHRRGTGSRAGDVDDLARLVPEYVTLPRGVRSESRGGVVVARPSDDPAHRADADRGPAGRPRHRGARASTRRGRPRPTATTSRRTGSPSTSSPGSATRSRPTAGCG